MTERSWWQELEVAGLMASTVKKQGGMKATAQLTLLGICPAIRMGLLVSVN